MSRHYLAIVVLAGMALIPSVAITQEARQSRSHSKGRDGFNPEQMQKRMLLNVKQRLAASNDEWKVLMPKVEKVMTAQSELQEATDRPGPPPGMGQGQRGGPGGFDAPQGQNQGRRDDSRRRDSRRGPGNRDREAGGPEGPGGPSGPDGAGGPGGPPDRDGFAEQPAPQGKVAQAQQELRVLVDDKEASPEDIAAKLTAYRQVRDKAREELQTAQKDLKAAATPRQEAILVVMGLLD